MGRRTPWQARFNLAWAINVGLAGEGERPMNSASLHAPAGSRAMDASAFVRGLNEVSFDAADDARIVPLPLPVRGSNATKSFPLHLSA